MYLDICLVMSKLIQPQSKISFTNACLCILILLIVSCLSIGILAWQQDKNDNKNTSLVKRVQ
jgi:hypothetical protein